MTTEPLEAAALALATARLTRAITDDEIGRPVREAVERAAGPTSRATYLVNCPACTSVWAAAVTMIIPRPIRWALALSQAAIWLMED